VEREHYANSSRDPYCKEACRRESMLIPESEASDRETNGFDLPYGPPSGMSDRDAGRPNTPGLFRALSPLPESFSPMGDRGGQQMGHLPVLPPD